MSNSASIKVLVCDAQPLTREGLFSILGRASDMTVTGEAEDVSTAIAVAREFSPDVILVNHDATALDGFELAAKCGISLRDQRPDILMLSSELTHGDVLRAFKSGIRGLLPNRCLAESLVSAIRDVAAGGMVIRMDPAVQLLEHLIQRSHALAAARPAQLDVLTPRELDVLALIASGHSNQRIAKELSLSEATVKSHLYHLCQKLNLRDRTQAAILAYETGLVRPRAAA
ncbi:LuxR C-terminal-related transcriptional regulator [Streptomyces sp. NPDC090021]|uniref:LuxR C-terminal-related transcriptional regulator n=1 Tax=Streptomyces sp. NPDC090021 TaxID=3365919 RepID=UPI00382723E2